MVVGGITQENRTKKMNARYEEFFISVHFDRFVIEQGSYDDDA